MVTEHKETYLTDHVTESDARAILNEYLAGYSSTEDFILGLIAAAAEKGHQWAQDNGRTI